MPTSTRAARLSPSLLAAAFMALALTQPLTAVPIDDVDIDNFGQINSNYYRGGQPDRAGFATLKRLGVKAVINLRADAERTEPRWVEENGMHYFHIPLTTDRPATAEQTAYFLQLVNDPANQPVYVHCKGGKHRAGQMTALYRITQDGWTADQAYREMQRYKFDTFPFHASLKNYVYEYYGGFTQSRLASVAPSTPAVAAGAAGTAGSEANAAGSVRRH